MRKYVHALRQGDPLRLTRPAKISKCPDTRPETPDSVISRKYYLHCDVTSATQDGVILAGRLEYLPS